MVPQCLWFAAAGHRDRPEHEPALRDGGMDVLCFPPLLPHAHAALGVCADPRAQELRDPSGQRPRPSSPALLWVPAGQDGEPRWEERLVPAVAPGPSPPAQPSP